MRVDISRDPRATHYCKYCGLVMKARDELMCRDRDGDLCEAKKREPRAKGVPVQAPELGEAWAVRIKVNDILRAAWLNPGGGYSPERRNRKLWQDYDEALDASHEWDMHDPVIVRVRFKAAPSGSADR